MVEVIVETAEPALADTGDDGVRSGAFGILGRADGQPHRHGLYSGRRPPPIRTKETGLEIRPGDVLVFEAGGDGGWADPAERCAQAIASDVEHGFVNSPARKAGG